MGRGRHHINTRVHGLPPRKVESKAAMLARLNTPEKSDTVEYFRPRRDKNDIACARGLKRQKKERQALRAHELAVGTMAFVESKKEGNVTGEPSTAEVSPARTCDWRGGKEPTRDACDRVLVNLKDHIQIVMEFVWESVPLEL